jgi:hypothetical protein
VYISGTVIASDSEYLPRDVAQAKQTNGRSAVVKFLGRDEPPPELSVTTDGIDDRLPN